jgi:hypothetical protein
MEFKHPARHSINDLYCNNSSPFVLGVLISSYGQFKSGMISLVVSTVKYSVTGLYFNPW